MLFLPHVPFRQSIRKLSERSTMVLSRFPHLLCLILFHSCFTFKFNACKSSYNTIFSSSLLRSSSSTYTEIISYLSVSVCFAVCCCPLERRPTHSEPRLWNKIHLQKFQQNLREPFVKKIVLQIIVVLCTNNYYSSQI